MKSVSNPEVSKLSPGFETQDEKKMQIIEKTIRDIVNLFIFSPPSKAVKYLEYRKKHVH